jgi:ketol-acid reductoisomerase
MAATIFYDKDADLSIIQSKKVAVLGYGSQGHAHALNMMESGVDVTVGLRPGSASRAAAEAAGLKVADTLDAARDADVIVVLVPDTKQKALWEGGLKDAVAPGNALVFGHGLAIHFGLISPPENVDVFLIAPKSPGHMVRAQFVSEQGTPGLIAIQQDATGTALELGKSYGMAIGCARAGLLQTTFKEETETDLFGEQAVLCGGASQLVLQGFKTLTDAGYQPEVAYFECLHELKLIVDMMVEGGVSWMRHSISETAEWGDYLSGPRVINESSKKAMEDILAEIQDGTFVKNMVAEWDNGAPEYDRMRLAGRDEPIEKVGKELRSMMSWISNPDIPA